jgi:protein-disulfide isomerase
VKEVKGGHMSRSAVATALLVIVFGAPAEDARADHVVAPGVTHRLSPTSDGHHPALGSPTPLVTVRYWIAYRTRYHKHAMELIDKMVAKNRGMIRVVALLRSRGDQEADKIAAIARELYILGGDELFWRFHRKAAALKKPYSLSVEKAIKIAAGLGARIPPLRAAIKKGLHEERIYRDTMSAMKIGVQPSTHSIPLLINTSLQYVSSSTRTSWLARVIVLETKKAKKAMKKGVNRSKLAEWAWKKAVHQRMSSRRSRRYRHRYDSWKKMMRLVEEESMPVRRYSVPMADAPVKGSSRAILPVVLFADPIDSGSSKVWQIVQRLMKRYEGKIRLSVRFLPRLGYSRSAKICRLLLAARKQKKLWPLVEEAFKRRYGFRMHYLKSKKKLDVDLERLAMDAKSLAVKKQLAADIRLAQELGVYDSPVLFVNGIRLDSLDRLPAANIVLSAIVKRELRPGLLGRFFSKARSD